MEAYTLADIQEILGQKETTKAALYGARWCEFRVAEELDRLGPDLEPDSEEEVKILEVISAYHFLAEMAREAAGGAPTELSAEQWDAYVNLIESVSEPVEIVTEEKGKE